MNPRPSSEVLTGIITRVGGGCRSRFVFVEDIRDKQYWAICGPMWLEKRLATSGLNVGDYVKLEVQWTRLKERPPRFKVERASRLSPKLRATRDLAVELRNLPVFGPSTYIRHLGEAKQALNSAHLAPRSRVRKRQPMIPRWPVIAYCPFCRSKLGVRLVTRTMTLASGEELSWITLPEKSKVHSAATCSANLTAIISTLRGKARWQQIRRKLAVSILPGSCTEMEWQQIVALQAERCFDCRKRRPLTRGHLVPVVHPKASLEVRNVIAQCRSCNGKQGRQIHVEALRRKLISMPDVRRWAQKRGDGPPTGLYRPRKGRT